MLDVAGQIRFRDLIDILVIALLLYTLIVWARRARVGPVLSGLSTLTLIYLLATLFQLQLTVWVFQGLFAVVAIVLIVIFQSELRQLFERLAAWEFGDRGHPQAEVGIVGPVTEAASRLASSKVGALIVVPGRDPLERHVAGGTFLHGALSVPLVESLFDSHSPGHDGAVILEGARVSSFGVHLPLSTDFTQLKNRGTRHAAALGLAERCDALSIIVSEERGEISVARDGRIDTLTGPPELTSRLDAFLQEKTMPTKAEARRRILSWRRNWAEKLIAVTIALLAWVVFVSDYNVESRVVSVPVLVENLPGPLRLTRIEPDQIAVRFQGTRRSLGQLETQRVSIVLDAALANAGDHTLQVGTANVRSPAGLEIVEIEPGEVRIELAESGREGIEIDAIDP